MFNPLDWWLLFANLELHGLLFLKNGEVMRQVTGLESELQTPLQAAGDRKSSIELIKMLARAIQMPAVATFPLYLLIWSRQTRASEQIADC